MSQVRNAAAKRGHMAIAPAARIAPTYPRGSRNSAALAATRRQAGSPASANGLGLELTPNAAASGAWTLGIPAILPETLATRWEMSTTL